MTFSEADNLDRLVQLIEFNQLDRIFVAENLAT